MTSSWAVIDGQRPGSHPKASGRRWDGIWMGVVRGLHALLGPWAQSVVWLHGCPDPALSPRPCPSAAPSGSCQARRTTWSTFGTCRPRRSCRSFRATQVSGASAAAVTSRCLGHPPRLIWEPLLVCRCQGGASRCRAVGDGLMPPLAGLSGDGLAPAFNRSFPAAGCPALKSLRPVASREWPGPRVEMARSTLAPPGPHPPCSSPQRSGASSVEPLEICPGRRLFPKNTVPQEQGLPLPLAFSLRSRLVASVRAGHSEAHLRPPQPEGKCWGPVS